jgi:hypothetical protein
VAGGAIGLVLASSTNVNDGGGVWNWLPTSTPAFGGFPRSLVLVFVFFDPPAAEVVARFVPAFSCPHAFPVAIGAVVGQGGESI